MLLYSASSAAAKSANTVMRIGQVKAA